MQHADSIVIDGIRKFLRMQDMPLQEHQRRQSADVFDLIDGFDIIRQMVLDTQRVMGQQIHQTSQYDHRQDVKYELEELLFAGKCDRDIARLRKKNLVMYHLVLEPTIDMLGHDHATAIHAVDSIIQQLMDYVRAFDAYGHEDDGIVAYTQIKNMVRQREDQRRLQKEARRPRRKRVENIEY